MEETAPKQKEEQRMLMSILSYLGPLVIVPFIAASDNEFVKFHIRQGLVLLTIEIVTWLLLNGFPQFYMIWQLIELGVLVLAVVGITNVTRRKIKNLPLVGVYAKYFKI